MATPRIPVLVSNPLLFGVLLLLAGAVVLAIPNPILPRFFIVLGLLLVYIFVTSVCLLLLPHWWLRALVTLLMGPIVMFGLIFISEQYEAKSVGEASLALLGPMMMHWVVVPATGIVKLVMRSTATASSQQQGPGLEPPAPGREPRSGEP